MQSDKHSDTFDFHDDATSELWGPTLPQSMQKKFSGFIAQLTYAVTVDANPFEEALKVRSAGVHQQLKANRPVGVAREDYLVWQIRTAATAIIAGTPELARGFLEGEAVAVTSEPANWLSFVRESVLVACLELLGGFPRNWTTGGDSAVSQLSILQKPHEKTWLDTLDDQAVADKKRAALELLGHYHFGTALLKVGSSINNQSGESRDAAVVTLKAVMDKCGIAYGHADQMELLLLVPVMEGACRALIGIGA